VVLWCKILLMRISDIWDRLISYSHTNELFFEGSRIIAALSGGSDSMLMLRILYEFHKKGYISLYAFHLNHSLRAEADEEEAFVRSYCDSLGIPLKVEKADIRLYAKQHSISEESAGREIRYSLMRKLKADIGYDLIATAHHADDNAETVIMRLVRGTSLNGLCGIAPKNDDIIRPVLFLSKDEILEICECEDIPYVTDMSNFDDKYFRNRIRNNVIPLLKEDNPKFTEAVLRTTETLRDVRDYLERQTDKVELTFREDSISCNIDDILSVDRFIVSFVLMKMCRMLTGGKDIARNHIQKLTELVISGDVRWEYHIPGMYVYLYDGVLSFSLTERQNNKNSYEYDIEIGTDQYFEREKMHISTKILKKDKNFCINSYIKAIDYDKIRDRLFIVSRKDGMKFRPAGKGMTKKLSKYFSDMKLPMAMRDIIPVFMCGDDIVCVGGYDVDEKYRITKDTQNILTISVTYEGENDK